jgi:hypothetical protein
MRTLGSAGRRRLLELLGDADVHAGDQEETQQSPPLAMLEDGPSSLQQAQCYVVDARSLWAQHPAALATLMPLRAVTSTRHYLDGQLELPSVDIALRFIADIPDVRSLPLAVRFSLPHNRTTSTQLQARGVSLLACTHTGLDRSPPQSLS